MSKILAFIVLILGGILLYFNWQKETPTVQNDVTKEEITVSEELGESLVEDIEEPVVVNEEEKIASQEEEQAVVKEESVLKPTSNDADLPKDIDRMSQLFQPYPPTLPIVETVSYSSKVDWLTGRPAYLGDYASYYQTSKHFISRSLKGAGQYFSEAVSKGDRFNVFKKDKNVQFHLVLDLSRLKLWTYYYDVDKNERVLLKTYPVCVGRLDSHRESGCLTPTGVFTLGEDIAIYKPGVLGTWRNEKKEMISIFGVRWIPLGKEIANCTGSCKGLGFHGVPWKRSEKLDEYIENRECIGRYESGGCIRLLSEDIEELFSVIISKPTYVYIVKDFFEASLPGKENP